MSWKDRIQGKAFEPIEAIEHGGEKVQSIKNNNKYKVPKDYLRDFTHKPQKPQKTQKGEVDPTSTVKDQSTPPDPGDLSQPPAGSTPEYKKLWAEAWTLADEIDDPNGAPIAERRAKLPELDELRQGMAAIERQAISPAGPDPEPSPAETWHTWESTDTATRDRNPENCPARCRRTGKCYAAAYFKGNPGRAKDCEPEGCKHISNERGSHDS